MFSLTALSRTTGHITTSGCFCMPVQIILFFFFFFFFFLFLLLLCFVFIIGKSDIRRPSVTQRRPGQLHVSYGDGSYSMHNNWIGNLKSAGFWADDFFASYFCFQGFSFLPLIVHMQMGVTRKDFLFSDVQVTKRKLKIKAFKLWQNVCS